MVLPIRVAPASSSRCTAQECRVGTGLYFAQSGLPPPVGWPATSNRSLAAKVRPESGPPARPSIWTRGPGTKALMSSSGMETSGSGRIGAAGSAPAFYPSSPPHGTRCEADVNRTDDPERIARSLKRSAEQSRRRKAGAFQSAMSMRTSNRPRRPQPARRAQEVLARQAAGIADRACTRSAAPRGMLSQKAERENSGRVPSRPSARPPRPDDRSGRSVRADAA